MNYLRLLLLTLTFFSNSQIALAQDANFLENPSFDAGLSRWTESGGTFTKETSLQGTGVTSGKWDPSATSQTLKTELVEIPNLNKGRNCYAEINYSWETGTLGHIIMYVEDNSSTKLTGDLTVVPTTGKWIPAGISFLCPATGTIRIVLETTADPDAILIDQTHLGEDFRIGVTESVIVQDIAGELTVTEMGTIVDSETSLTRIGDWLHGIFRFKAVTPHVTNVPELTLPAGLTIDPARLVGLIQVGSYSRAGGSDTEILSAAGFSGTIFYDGSTNNILYFGRRSTSNSLDKDQANLIASANENIHVRFRIPIAEWAGQGTTNTVTLDNQDWYIDAKITGANIPQGTSDDGGVFSANGSSSLTLTTSPGSAEVFISCQSAIPNGSTCPSGNEVIGPAFVAPLAGAYEVCLDYGNSVNVITGTRVFSVYRLSYTADATSTEIISGTQLRFMDFDNKSGSTVNHAGNGVVCVTAELSAGLASFKLFESTTVVSGTVSAHNVSGSGNDEIHITVKKLHGGNSTVAIVPATATTAGGVKALKQYVGGTDFTITSTAVATVAFIRSVIVPYQTFDGAWRAKINIALTHGADAAHVITIAGITFKNVSGYDQAMSTKEKDGRAKANPNAETITVNYVATATSTSISGDIELDSKPTWAD